ncbi:MAG: hypothetical protein FJ215_13725 [Ignavibacteria bacterium]|nr:hypothetical protein [Ignavibacteria bacterium]
MESKLSWSGAVVAIQPRIRLMRSFDQRDHSYLGYSLRIDGTVDSLSKSYTIGIGKSLQARHGIRAGDLLEGVCSPVGNSDLETVDYYKVSRFQVVKRSETPSNSPPPWVGVPPSLEIYRERGHRRLAAQTYERSCVKCIWGCFMAVEMIIDQWNPSQRKYRRETFCYGPKSCSLYRAGPPRKVPGRKGMSWTEEDWVDEEATRHRSNDD